MLFDGVFHHVGRGFWAFEDVRRRRLGVGWGGGVKLNLHNPDVVNHIFDAIRGWVADYGIDGLRLDVAYSLDEAFCGSCAVYRGLKPEFVLVGETLHGDYNRWMNP